MNVDNQEVYAYYPGYDERLLSERSRTPISLIITRCGIYMKPGSTRSSHVLSSMFGSTFKRSPESVRRYRYLYSAQNDGDSADCNTHCGYSVMLRELSPWHSLFQDCLAARVLKRKNLPGPSLHTTLPFVSESIPLRWYFDSAIFF